MNILLSLLRKTRPWGVVFLPLLAVAVALGEQTSASVETALAEEGKPVSGGLVVLQRIKDAECVKLFTSREASPKARKKLHSCATDLPWVNTDAGGKHEYQQLAPGWYDVRFLWLMEKAPAGGKSIACAWQDWALFFEPGRDNTGKYNAMAQGKPFELKELEAKQITFDYRGQFEVGANCVGHAAASEEKTGKARISVPGKRGVLEIDAGPTPWSTEVRAQEAEIYFSALHRSDHLLVTAFLQQVAFAASPEKCRDVRWRNEEHALRSHHIDPGHVKKSSQDGVARVEFFIDHSPGGKLEMQDVHAYMGSGALCAEVHLSKVFFRPEEQKLFDEVLASVRFLPDETPETPAK